MEKRQSKLSDSPSEKVIKVEGLRNSKTEETKRKGSKGCGVPCEKEQEDVQLVEDVFSLYYDENGDTHKIKRFTWKNKNKIQVQVINYGARITSMKVPDRKGRIEDIVLGFDDFAGYFYNKKFYFGATIGRMSNIVRNGTFEIDNKQYWLSQNKPPHHFNGGEKGLDQVVWKTYIEGKKVIMSYVSPHLNEGYPGDLLVRICFELSARNEFHINMDAQSTKPTIVNLSNLTYFNLAGHYAGPDHLYKHVITVNSNCFIPQIGDIPTGEILNVVHTRNDFQIPQTLGKLIGIVPRDGYNQNLCVSRGVDQGDCFVARVLHPPSGRMLEIYSNQCGVTFSTADEFGYGRVLSMEQLMPEDDIVGPDPILALFEKVHKELIRHLAVDERDNYRQIRDLIVKIREKAKAVHLLNNTPETGSVMTLEPCSGVPEKAPSKVEAAASRSATAAQEEEDGEEEEEEEEQSCVSQFMLTPLQMDYLENTFKIVCEAIEEDEWLQLKEVMAKIIDSTIMDDMPPYDIEEEEVEAESLPESFQIPSVQSAEIRTKKKIIKENKIPFYYKSTDKIVGKERAVYHMHGGMALQTQNYPACANYKNFPSCVLRPGEVYKHTITYKFWVRAGNPNKWIKRNLIESKRGY